MTHMRKMLLVIGTTVALAGSASVAKADTVYTGADNSVSSLAQMTNSLAAEAAFAAAAPGDSVVTFESALPAGFTASGGSITNSACGAVCGFNTTAGGSYFYNLYGGTATFNFATAINSFGMYVTGLQTDLVPQETLTFSDGSSETINTPASINGGGAFIGFTDFGKSIVSVSYNATNDIVSIDDVMYGSGASTATPEPSTLSLMSAGLLGLGLLIGMKRYRGSNLATEA